MDPALLSIVLLLLGVAFVGMELFTRRPVGDTMMTTVWGSSSSWTLTALPLFIVFDFATVKSERRRKVALGVSLAGTLSRACDS